MSNEDSFKMMMRYIADMIDTQLVKQTPFIEITRCVFFLPDTQNINVSPSLVKIFNTMEMEVQHKPLFLCYRFPQQILSRSNAQILRDKFNMFLECSYTQCVECKHLCPEVCCKPCKTCTGIVCDYCEPFHEYTEEKNAKQQGDPKRVLM